MLKITIFRLLFLPTNSRSICNSCEKMKNYITQIAELNQDHVRIKHPEKVNTIIENIIMGGYDKLQVVSDFDKTITKQHENGKTYLSSFGKLLQCFL